MIKVAIVLKSFVVCMSPETICEYNRRFRATRYRVV